MMTTIGLKIDDETRQRLNKLGEIKERTPHWMMKKAVAEYLEREERYEAELKEDMRRWENYLNTNRYISEEDMNNKFSKLIAKASD